MKILRLIWCKNANQKQKMSKKYSFFYYFIANLHFLYNLAGGLRPFPPDLHIIYTFLDFILQKINLKKLKNFHKTIDLFFKSSIINNVRGD